MSEKFNIGNFQVDLSKVPAKERAKVFQNLVNIVSKLEELKVECIKICNGKII